MASFPVHYNANFYRDILRQNSRELNKLAYVKKQLVGAVCTRIEETEQGRERLYIMTLAVVPTYRSKGVGTRLIQSILHHCQSVGIPEVALHVQISNEDAIRFYVDRFGFRKGNLLENYYHRIDPPHCYELTKILPLSSSLAKVSDEVCPVVTTSDDVVGTNEAASRSKPSPAKQRMVSETSDKTDDIVLRKKHPFAQSESGQRTSKRQR